MHIVQVGLCSMMTDSTGAIEMTRACSIWGRLDGFDGMDGLGGLDGLDGLGGLDRHNSRQHWMHAGHAVCCLHTKCSL